MPDELTTATLEARRTEICAALEFSALNMKQALELMAELEDIDKKLANLGLCALGDFADERLGMYMDGAAYERAEINVMTGISPRR